MARYIEGLWGTVKEVSPVEWSETEKIIIAWALSTDGCIGMSRESRAYKNSTPYLRPRLSFDNKDLSLVSKFHRIVRYGRVSSYRQGDKRMWKWICNSYREIELILENILPFIPAQRKKKEAEILLDFIKKRLNRESWRLDDSGLETYQLLRELKEG